MKKQGITLGISFLLIVVVCTTCTKDETFPSSNGESPAFKSASVENITITVPTPAGIIDCSDDIENALIQAREAGPGSIVQLLEGTYYITRNMKVEGFDGYLKGAGKDKTAIKLLPGEKIDGVTGIWGMKLSSVLTFYGGNIRISDLSFVFTDSEPAGDQDLNDIFLNALVYIIEITVNNYQTTVSSSFDNVGFIGANGNYFGHNLAHCVFIGNASLPIGGSHCLTNCDFINSVLPYSSYLCKDGSFIIGGVPRSGNRFSSSNYGVSIEDTENSLVEISHNRFDLSSWVSINIIQSEEMLLSTYNIEHNDISVLETGDGISIMDYKFVNTGEEALSASVSHNNISLNTTYGGIWVNTLNTEITNNTISGTGFSGIYSFAGEGLIIRGNNVQNITSINNPWLGDGAPVWLGPETRNCIVIGGSNKTNVMDFGTENIITGVNNMQGNPPGPMESLKHNMVTFPPHFNP